jgi:hypothetical protein
MALQPGQVIVYFTQNAARANIAGLFGAFPAGRLVRVDVACHAANAAGPTTFDVNLNGASVFAAPGDRPSIAGGQRAGFVEGLDVAVAAGDEITFDLDVVPAGGVAGPIMLQVMIDDGVQSGTDAVLPMADFAAAYYQGILGRDPSAGELAAAVTALTNGCVAETFATSAAARLDALFLGAEFLALATTDAQFVAKVYRAYFNREPDAGGQAFWEGELAAGGAPANAANRATMRATFAAHKGFVNRAALYCRNQLPVANAIQIQGQNPTVFVQGVIGTAITGIDLVVYSTAVLADGATEYVSLPMGGKFWKLYRLAADRSCRVRAYLRQAQRLADAARPIGANPTGEHGCIFDFYLPPTNLDWDSARRPDGCNLDDLTSSNAWVAVTNMSGAAAAVQIILHRRLL